MMPMSEVGVRGIAVIDEHRRNCVCNWQSHRKFITTLLHLHFYSPPQANAYREIFLHFRHGDVALALEQQDSHFSYLLGVE
jgi:hypothetical protein